MPNDGSSTTTEALNQETTPVEQSDTRNGGSANQYGGELRGSSVPSHVASLTVSSPDNNEGKRNYRPPLPPRPANLALLQESNADHDSPAQRHSTPSRPQLQSVATTVVSRTDIHTQSYQDGSRETFAASADSTPPIKTSQLFGSIKRIKGLDSSEGGDSASIRSFAPTSEIGGDNESMLGDVFGGSQEVPAWKLFSGPGDTLEPSEENLHKDNEVTVDFYREFDALKAVDDDGSNEEQLLSQWKSKRKHFLILSSAGKPIYSRHGDDNLISSSIGIIQTIISFYEGSDDQLKGFSAAGARFVIMSQGPLYLVAISKLGENDAQLRVQLEALYMQILSTLTLPTLNHLFSNRPSTDLRRPLKGTEVLLSALADTFTRGSPPTLLSALECLKLRKSQRQIISDTLLRRKCDPLLYGLVVAGGRLVSVVRPRKHSLHPSDLQLIFNMLFEADGIKTGGGENWVPLCLPGFNKKGYLYMYVSFFNALENDGEPREDTEQQSDPQDTVTILLISANKESFYDLRKMRDDVVDELEKNGSMAIVKAAIGRGRSSITDIVPGTVLRHFLYKSKGNVQYVMPSYEPHYTTLLARRRLLSLYHTLHGSVHAKNAHLKVHHCISHDSVSLAWVSPIFELYCVSGPNASRNALAQSANKVVQWVRREEERVFIIGGAVF